MKRILVLAAASLLATTVASSVPGAAAVPRPTINGPSHATYFQLVTLTGTTPTPHQHVVIYFKGPGLPVFTPRRDLHSDASGHYKTTYRATGTYSYYARSRSVSSRIDSTHVIRVTCKVSDAPFQLPLGRDPRASRSNPDFVAFTAMRDGKWAGVTQRGSVMAVITWRPHHPVHIVATFDYRRVSWEPAFPGSVAVLGLTPHGYVVTNIQRVTKNLEDDVVSGYVWIHGVGHRLARADTWKSVHVTGVSAAGTIVGYVREGGLREHGKYSVVSWNETGSHVTTIAVNATNPVVDAAGDIAYLDKNLTPVVHLVTGQTRTLGALPGGPNGGDNVQVQTGGGDSMLYGTSDSRLTSWNAHAGDLTTDVAPEQLSGWGGPVIHSAAAAGTRGDVLDGSFAVADHPQYLLTATGARVKVPQQLNADISLSRGPGEVVTSSGALAYTSATDWLVHFLHCKER